MLTSIYLYKIICTNMLIGVIHFIKLSDNVLHRQKTVSIKTELHFIEKLKTMTMLTKP